MRKALAVLLASLLAAIVWPVQVTAGSDRATVTSVTKDHRGDLARSRAAMSAAADRFDATYPAVPGAERYFADYPISFAHPSGDPVSMRQPNGLRFGARLRSMDFGGGVETWNTGHTIVRDRRGWWVYAVPGGGGLVPSTARVGMAQPPSGVPTHLGIAENTIWATEEDLPAIREQMFLHMGARNQALNEAAEAAGEPRVFKVPVLMLETYSEWLADSTPQKFEAMLSGHGGNPTGTMTELYEELSYDKFSVDVDVFGFYTSAASQGYRCFYGTEGSVVGGDTPVVGGPGLGGGGAKGMAAEAVPQADPAVNFGDYDNDNDGWVDYLIILHSGPDAAATGDPCHTWSHFFPQVAGEPAAATNDVNAEGEPVKVGNVLTMPEVDLQIGVAAHEMMHALGEPDYYATNYTNSGTGDWDLGAGGAWYGDPPQSNPLHFNPMMKMNLGWAEPTLVRQTRLGMRLRPREMFPDLLWVPVKMDKNLAPCQKGQFGKSNITAAFKIGDECAVEGYLIEQNSRSVPGAKFDRYSLGSGLLIWHYDLTKWVQGGNNDFLRPMLDIEEFDRRDDVQDLQANNTRGDPMDVFFGDPVGISSATATPDTGAGNPQAGQEWTVSGTPCACGNEAGEVTAAKPVPHWVVEPNPDNKLMIVSVQWQVDSNDWDLYLEKKLEDGTWQLVNRSAGSANPEVVSVAFPGPGEYRALVYNWASAEPVANVKLEFRASGLPVMQTANTLSNDLAVTGWSFTNIRPYAFDGLEVPFEHGNHTMTLDLIKHDDTTVDLSADFVDTTGRLFRAGEAVTLATRVYQHGGKAVGAGTRVQFRLGSAQGTLIAQRTLGALAGFSQTPVTATWTPQKPGPATIVTRLIPPSGSNDLVAGNNSVATQLEVAPSGARLLVVDDDDGFPADQAFAGALQGLRIPFAIVQGTASSSLMKRFPAVIWNTANARFDGQLAAHERQAVKAYLADGGRLWLAGPNAPRAFDADDTRVGRVDPAFLHEYFGVAYVDSMQRGAGTAAGTNDAVGGGLLVGVRTPYARTLMDYVRLGDTGSATASTLGQASAVFRWPDIEGALVGSKLQATSAAGGFRTVLTTFDLAQVVSGAQRVQVATNILAWLGVGAGAYEPGNMIRHASLRATNPGTPQVITAAVAGSVQSVTLHYRPHGAATWTAVPMSGPASGHYTATIPAARMARGGVDYYIEARGASIVLRDPRGGPAMPHYIAALA